MRVESVNLNELKFFAKSGGQIYGGERGGATLRGTMKKANEARMAVSKYAEQRVFTEMRAICKAGVIARTVLRTRGLIFTYLTAEATAKAA